MAGAVFWSLPMLAAALLALLRYGFGSLFLVGESVASVILRSTGADIAGTIERLNVHPLWAAGEAACGVVASGGAAALAMDQPQAAGAVAAAAAAWGWWYGMPTAVVVLISAGLFGLIAGLCGAPRP